MTNRSKLLPLNIADVRWQMIGLFARYKGFRNRAEFFENLVNRYMADDDGGFERWLMANGQVETTKSETQKLS